MIILLSYYVHFYVALISRFLSVDYGGSVLVGWMFHFPFNNRSSRLIQSPLDYINKETFLSLNLKMKNFFINSSYRHKLYRNMYIIFSQINN